MTKSGICYYVVGLWLLGACFAGVAFAQTVVAVSPATKNLLPGNTVLLNIDVSNVTNLHASSVKIAHNKNFLRLTDSLYTIGSFWSGFFVAPLPPSIISGPVFDTMQVDLAILGTGQKSGSGTLFSVSYTGMQNGVTPMILAKADLRQFPNIPITSSRVDGQVTVNNPDQVYVDSSYSSSNQGGHEFGYDGHNTLASGLAAVNIGGTINIAPATYSVTFDVTKNVTLTPMSGIPVIRNLTVNTAAVSLGGSFQISTTLTLTNGLLNLGSGNLLLGSSATIAGTPSASTMVVAGGSGQLRKAFAGIGSFTFPVGDNTGTPEYSPVTLNFTSGSFASAYAGVSVANAKHPMNTSTTTYLNRYWTVVQSGISSFTCDASFKYLPADVVGSEGGLALGQWDGARWAVVGGFVPTNSLFGSGLTSFSDFTGGEESALPIQLASFNGHVLQNGDVQLTWVTLSEVSNYGFYVQRKRPTEEQYYEIPNSFVPGHGTTTEPHTYAFVDVTPGTGTWQYRLRQVDLDGTLHYTDPIQVDVVTGVNEGLRPNTYSLRQNFPNPFNPSTAITYTVPAATHVTLKIFNILGEEIVSLVDGLVSQGEHTAQWSAEAIPSGIYLCKLTAGKFVETRKLVLEK